MSNALQVVTGSPISTGAELLAKAQSFKEIGVLVQSGLFPKGIDTVQKVQAVCWMADAVGAHPMVALQNCAVIHGRVTFGWRFKWGLIKSRYPAATYEVVEASATRHALRGRVTEKQAWTEAEFTTEQCAKNPVTSANDLYRSDWADMGFKAAMNRLMDRIAPEVLMGLPSGELQEVASESELPGSGKPAQRSAAEVLEAASGAGAVEAGAGTGGNPPARQGAPAVSTAPPAGPAVLDPIKACFAKIDEVFKLNPKTAGPKRRSVCEEVLSKLRGEKVKLTTTMAPSDGADILAYLNEKYPEAGAVSPEPTVVAGESGSDAIGGSGAVSPAGADDPATTGGGEGTAGTDAPAALPKNFDEQHADMNEMPLEGDEVPLEPDVDPDVQAAAEAADRERFERDGDVLTIIDMARAAAKTHPNVPVLKESPAKSGKWYLTNMKVMEARGRTTGRLIYTVGEKGAITPTIDADECRALVYLLREQGMMGTVTR